MAKNPLELTKGLLPKGGNEQKTKKLKQTY